MLLKCTHLIWFSRTPLHCVPLPILSLSGVDRHDCLSPSFSVLGELWVELLLFQIAPHSVHPSQSGPSTTSLPSHLHRCYMFCYVRFVSSHHMAIPRKAFLGDIRGDRLDHRIAPELFISDSVFPCFALNPSYRFHLGCVHPLLLPYIASCKWLQNKLFHGR